MQIFGFRFETRLDSDLISAGYLLVEEQDHRNGSQPAIVPNRLEQIERFSESVLTGILAQDHVIGRASCHEDNGRHVVETLNPLAPLVTLTSHIKHAAQQKETITIKSSDPDRLAIFLDKGGDSKTGKMVVKEYWIQRTES